MLRLMEGHLGHRQGPPPICCVAKGQLLTPLGSPNFCSCEVRLRKWVVKDPLICMYFPIPQAPGTHTPNPTHIFLEQLLSIFGEEAGKAVCLLDLGLQVGKG